MNFATLRLEPLFIGTAAVSIGIGIGIAMAEQPNGNAKRPNPAAGVRRKPAPPSWQAYSLQWQMFPTTPEPGTGDIATVRIPGPLSGEYLSMLTTTNWPGVIGGGTSANMTRHWVSMTMILDAIGVEPPVLFSSAWGNEDWNTCPALPSVRLFFTSARGKYNVNDANDHPENYWWCCTDFGSWTLTAVDNRGAYLEASISDPHQWTDALGRSAMSYTNAFYNCVSNIAQLGLSAGGNCFYDTGVALSSQGADDEDGIAVLHITNFEVQ